LWDADGHEYLDALGGIAVTFLGHCHPKISEAISLQANKILHTSNLFHIQEQADLGERFCAISGMDKVILTAEQSFHGRTMATLSATGNAAIQKGFAPLLNEFIHVPYNDVRSMRKHSDNPNVVAIMVEPIQGEGGIVVPDAGYLKSLRALCDEQNGIPIGACAAKGAAAELISPGLHGTTFGGNPFASKIATTVIDVIQEEHLVEKASLIGASLKRQLQHTLGTLDKVVDIRGQGLMLGIELDKVYPDLAMKLLDVGLVINITGGGKVIRLLPSVLLSEAQVKKIVRIIHDVVSTL